MTLNCNNLKAAIAVMERVRDELPRSRVKMSTFQSHDAQGKLVTSEAEMHACGNTACFAGWLAVSPEFKQAGGSVGNTAEPVLAGKNGYPAVAEFLGVSPRLAACFVHNSTHLGSSGSVGNFYPVPWSYVRAEHVLEKLYELRDKGYVEYKGEKLT